MMSEAHFWYRDNHIGSVDIETESDLDYICDTIMRAGFREKMTITHQKKRCKRILMDCCDDWHKPTPFQKQVLVGCILTLVKVGEISNQDMDGYIVMKKLSH